MYGNERVNSIIITGIIFSVIIHYGLLMNGWGNRIEWLQSLSIDYVSFLPEN